MKTFKSKEKVVLFCLLFFLVLMATAYSEPENKKLDLKIYGGLTYIEVGEWNAHHVGWNEQRRMNVEAAGGSVLSENQELHWGKEGAGDLYFYLSSRFALSAGAGYISGRVTDTAETIVGSVRARNQNDLKVRAVPIRLGAVYFIPLFSKGKVFAGAGLGYYFTKFDRFYRREPGDGYWIDSNMTGTSQGLGFDGVIGFEYSLSKKIALVVEGTGRYAKIGGVEGSRERVDSNNWSDSIKAPYYALERERLPGIWYTVVNIADPAPSGEGTRNVRNAVLDFSGFAVRVGLKINLC
jgi:hypothetical protein